MNLVIGDLVLLTRNTDDGFEVQVRSGSSGKALAGVEVLLYRYDYRRGHRRVASRRTDSSGEVLLAGPGRTAGSVFCRGPAG